MKKIFSITAIFSALLLFASCGQDDALDPLTGKYPVPTDVTLNTVSSRSDSLNAAGTLHIFNLTLTGSSVTMNAQFVCDKSWFLEARTYSLGNAAAKKLGTFVLENTTISNGTITDGTIQVEKSGDTYTIDGVFVMADGSIVRPHFKGDIVYVKPQPKSLTKFLSVSSSAVSAGYDVNMKVGTSGLALMSSPWGSYVAGAGEYASIDFICKTSALTPGIYTPVASSSPAVGGFIAGYQGDYNGYKYNAGTCYYTLDATGSQSAAMLTAGSITVTQSGTTYTITVDCGATYVSYTGALQ